MAQQSPLMPCLWLTVQRKREKKNKGGFDALWQIWTEQQHEQEETAVESEAAATGDFAKIGGD